MLHAAARGGEAENVESSIAAGADLEVQDFWGLSALHSAALAGHAEVLEMLLQKRASIDAKSDRGQTALHLAATDGHEVAVSLLLAHGADVLSSTAYGNKPLELARRRGARGAACQQRIRDDIALRSQRAAAEAEDLRQQMRMVEEMRERLGVQLGCTQEGGSKASGRSPTDAPTLLAGQRPKTPQKQSTENFEDASYWKYVSLSVAEIRAGCQDPSSRAFFREPSGEGDPFAWTGSLVAASPLPPPDPDDWEFVAGKELAARVEDDKRKRREMEPTGAAELGAVEDDLEAELLNMVMDVAVDEGTGRPQNEWDDLVAKLSEPEGSWDWSKIEVLEKRREETEKKTPGVFAVSASTPSSKKRGAVVFRQGDIIGPLGGVLRRRVRYEQLYYVGRQWMLHDPLAHEFRIRAKTADLKIEPVVLDIAAGAAQNRLRYLADYRNDPLGLKHIGVLSVEIDSFMPERGSMPRPCSPRSKPMPTLDEESLAENGYPASEARSQPRSQSPSYPATPMTAGAPSSTLSNASGELPGANVNLVEVHVKGWPYVFAVANRKIHAGEELTIDYGDEHWDASRFVLARLREIGELGRQIVRGSGGASNVEEGSEGGSQIAEEPVFSIRPRKPMKRANSKR